jgi:hypothetical protein
VCILFVVLGVCMSREGKPTGWFVTVEQLERI